MERILSPFLYPNKGRCTRQRYREWADENPYFVQYYPFVDDKGVEIECPVVVRRREASTRPRLPVLFFYGNG